MSICFIFQVSNWAFGDLLEVVLVELGCLDDALIIYRVLYLSRKGFVAIKITTIYVIESVPTILKISLKS